MKRNPFVLGLFATGVLALAVAGMFAVGLGESVDSLVPDRPAITNQVIPLVICIWVGVLAFIAAALLAGIGWEFRRDRSEFALSAGAEETTSVTTTADEPDARQGAALPDTAA